MITFVAHIDGSTVLGLGLTPGNLEKLQREPISLTAEQLGLPFQMNLLVFWGKSNAEMEREVHRTGKYGPGIEAGVKVEEDVDLT